MHPSRPLPILVVAGAAILAVARSDAQTLELMQLVAEQGHTTGDPSWFLNVDLEGSTNITSASVTPPGGGAIALDCQNQGTLVECDFEDLGFGSLAEVLATYPTGTWALELNGGARTASLDFARSSRTAWGP